MNITLSGSGDTISIDGDFVTEDIFDDGLVIRTPTSSDAGWNGTRTLTIEYMIRDVLSDGAPIDAVICTMKTVQPRSEEVIYVKAVITDVVDGHLVIAGGGRIHIEYDVYGVSI